MDYNIKKSKKLPPVGMRIIVRDSKQGVWSI